MIPLTAWLALGAAAAAAGGGWWARGLVADRAELARVQAEARTAMRRAETAADASTTFETDRAALVQRIQEARRALTVDIALAQPAQCPPDQPLGDLHIGADALAGVRAAAGQLEPDGAAGEPGPAVR